jgi:hypothetical protein
VVASWLWMWLKESSFSSRDKCIFGGYEHDTQMWGIFDKQASAFTLIHLLQAIVRDEVSYPHAQLVLILKPSSQCHQGDSAHQRSRN